MEKNRRTAHHGHRSGGLIVAFIFIAIGVILMCVNTGLMSPAYKHVLISWPMLFIVIGCAKLFKGQFGSSLIMFFVGAFFLLPRINQVNPDFFNFIPANFVQLYWPIFLIVIGAFLLLRWMFPSSKWVGVRGRNYRSNGFHEHETLEDGSIDINNLFSGSEQIVLDKEFKGGEINSIFGGTKLDLRRTNLPEGTTILDVNVVFGGLEIYLPLDWNIDVQVDTILGGFEDKRYGAQATDSTRKLIIKGACVFGGGELKN